MQASVKVMRSYDYCHFEVALSAEDVFCKGENEAERRANQIAIVDELRKDAAILVDEAVRQYKLAKAKEQSRSSREWQVREILERIKYIEAKSESEWTAEEAALMRSYRDKTFWASFDQDDYFYEDPEREHHFSMLRKFQNTRIAG